ncbi:MAG TPA: hypothetical protein PLS06_10920 [Proteiniphilum sp.]|nr:hypothetical protein [Proteiniphilum sp.]
MQAKLWLSCTVLVAMVAVSTVNAADWGLKKGNADLKSAGPLAFGPDGILLVGDVKAATVFAIDTGDASGDPGKGAGAAIHLTRTLCLGTGQECGEG